MLKIKENEEGKLEVYSPYNANFVREIKESISGARFDREKRAWIVPSDSRFIIEKLLSLHYGYTSDSKGISVQITSKKDLFGGKDSVRFGEWPICRATGRDSGAKVCENVYLISGKINSGGSVKNWGTEVDEGAVFLVKNIPRGILDKVDNERWDYEIIEENENKSYQKNSTEENVKTLKEIGEEILAHTMDENGNFYPSPVEVPISTIKKLKDILENL